MIGIINNCHGADAKSAPWVLSNTSALPKFQIKSKRISIIAIFCELFLDESHFEEKRRRKLFRYTEIFENDSNF